MEKAVPTRDKRGSDGPEQKLARSGDRDETAAEDLISRLPDDILGAVITLLSTREGGRTQGISRRWRHLWRSAPLNLEVCICDKSSFPASAVRLFPASDIISKHPGPARRFSFRGLSSSHLRSMVADWFDSPALDNLEELDISYATGHKSNTLPPSALRFASTLVVAKFHNCDFRNHFLPPTTFPLLKQLSLIHVSISRDIFHGLLSACLALESLYMSGVRATGRLRVSSPTLRCIGFADRKLKLVIDDAPSLERLLIPYCVQDDCVTTQIISAPKLEIFGPLSLDLPKPWIFQGMSPVSAANPMRALKVLALRSYDHGLCTVLDALRGFPCLERLYVIFFDKQDKMDMKSEPRYDPLNPIECLQTHLKKVVFKSYLGNDRQADFARFFVLNAKVLNIIEFEGFTDCSSQSVARQHRLLQVENRASRAAQFEFRKTCSCVDDHLSTHIHDLSVTDPFRKS